MTARSTVDRPRQRLVGGFTLVLLAELVVIPTGILTVALLTRQLGPAGYGLLGLAGAFVGWAEWAVTSSFTRATVKFVSEAQDWRPVASRAVQLQLIASVIVGLLLVALSEPIAALMHEPALAGLLRLYSIDLPVFCLAQAHRDVLVGRGLFKERALASGMRWIARYLLIFALLAAGLSIEGAIIGGIASSIVELAICRWYVQPRVFVRPTIAAGPLLGYVAPLSLFAFGSRLFDKMDLLTFKALGATAAAAGIYTSAESLTTLPAMLAVALTPLLVSSLADSSANLDQAKTNARRALGAMFIFLPQIGIVSGMSADLVEAVSGQAFAGASPLFIAMNYGAIAMFFVSVITSIMIAAGRPGATAWIIVPLLLGQLVGNILLIPRYGAIGAAWVTTACSVAGFIASIFVVRRIWGILPPFAPVARSIAVTVAAYLVTISWPLGGVLSLAKYGVINLGIVAAFWLFGDWPGSRGWKRGAYKTPARAAASGD